VTIWRAAFNACWLSLMAGAITTLGAALGGCASAVLQAAPLALQTTAALGAETANLVSNHHAAKTGDQGDDDFERSERCDDLGDTPPGIIQLKAPPSGGAPQWRPVVLDEPTGEPRWSVDGAKSGDWQPAQNLGAMAFSPPLSLAPNSISYLAYAPADPQTGDETAQLSGFHAEFEAHSGTFQWRERSYSYDVVNTLPCFPLAPPLK